MSAVDETSPDSATLRGHSEAKSQPSQYCHLIALLSYVRAAPARNVFVCDSQFGAMKIQMRFLPALTETIRSKIDFF